jgi:hypothetical protein
MTTPGKHQTEVDQLLTEAVEGHPWLRTLLDRGEPDPAAIGVMELIGGLTSFCGGLHTALVKLAAEMDRQDALR